MMAQDFPQDLLRYFNYLEVSLLDFYFFTFYWFVFLMHEYKSIFFWSVSCNGIATNDPFKRVMVLFDTNVLI